MLFLHRTIATRHWGNTRESDLTERVRTTALQREGAMRAAEVERTRIERDLRRRPTATRLIGLTLGWPNNTLMTSPTGQRAHR